MLNRRSGMINTFIQAHLTMIQLLTTVVDIEKTDMSFLFLMVVGYSTRGQRNRNIIIPYLCILLCCGDGKCSFCNISLRHGKLSNKKLFSRWSGEANRASDKDPLPSWTLHVLICAECKQCHYTLAGEPRI